METTSKPVHFDVESIRHQFPLLQETMHGKPLVFLDSAASSQKPEVVLEKIDHYYRHQHANVHRGVYRLSQEATDAYEHGRRVARQFLNASLEEEIIFVRGTTEAINLVADTYGRQHLKPGDEVIVSGLEHHSNIVPWQLACTHYGAKLKVIPVLDNGALDMEAFRQLLGDRTRMVAVAHVSNSLGTINPIREIIHLAHERNIPVLVDGAQAAPHLTIDVQALDADFYAFSGHKVYGPTGIGILYGKKKWLQQLPPYQGGGEMIAQVTFGHTTFADLPHKFEAGTPDIAGAVGLGAALEFVMQTGREAIASHESALLAYATERLLAIPGLRIYGTAPEKASVISFLLENVHPYDTGTILDQLGIAVRTGHHCTQPLMDRFGIPGTVRASFGVYNTPEDIDRLVAGVRKAASMLQ
ncbi:MAG: cysteine desulfurase [Saprospiraceae bacterium]|nr:cysteine desulfurase [Saprospiraceae bacterium]MCB9320561.1 cysteine desulfurase [Lewinellaceae bacterium]